jgi:TetR/AcrR family transcriptional regulator
MGGRRHQRQPTRAPGAGRPRKVPRNSDRPVAEEIIAGASRLFARRGVASTTMADIAEAAGLQVSSLYYYFRSKHEILETIVGEVNRIPRAALAEARAVHDEPAAALHAFIRADAEVLCRFPFDINEIHRLAGDDDTDFATYWSERQQLHDDVEALVADGVASGSLVDVDPHLTALTILANDEASQNWFRPVGARRLTGRGGASTERYTPEEVGAYLADMTLRALLRDPDALAAIRIATAG